MSTYLRDLTRLNQGLNTSSELEKRRRIFLSQEGMFPCAATTAPCVAWLNVAAFCSRAWLNHMYFYIFRYSSIGIKYDVCERIKVASRCDLATPQGGNFVIDQRLIPICVAGSVLTHVFTVSRRNVPESAGARVFASWANVPKFIIN